MRRSPPVRMKRSGSGSVRRARAAREARLVDRSAASAPLAHCAGELARGLHDVPSAAVAHGDLQLQARVAAGELLRPAAMRACRLTLSAVRSPMKRSRTLVRVQLGDFAVQRLEEQLHEAR